MQWRCQPLTQARFLLAKLYLQSLYDKRSANAVRNALKEITTEASGQKATTETEAYDYAYRLTMQRIEEQPPDRAELGKEVLAWITSLRQPFKASELRKALGIRVGQSAFDEDDCPDIIDMVSACAGLVTIDEESNLIRLVHYTTQEYLDRTQRHWFPKAETMITEACIAYLSMEEFGSPKQYSGWIRVNSECFQEKGYAGYMDPFYDYAACNWGLHAREASGVHQTIIGFFELSWNLRCAALMLTVPLFTTKNRRVHRRGWARSSRPEEDSTSGIHLSAHFGLRDTLAALLQQGYDVNAQDRLGHTALMLAAQRGHLDAVKILLHHGAKMEPRNKCDYSLLQCAVYSGNIEIVQLVIADKAVQSSMHAVPHSENAMRRSSRFSSLDIAVSHGYVSITRLLINHGLDVNLPEIVKDWPERDPSPLESAAQNDNREILDMLLEAGADIHCWNRYGDTILHSAADKHKTSQVHYLLSKGFSINQQNRKGRTPLLSLYHGDIDDTYLLSFLRAGPDTNICDNRGRSILHWASSEDKYYLIPILIIFGAKVSIISDYEVRVRCIEKLRRYLRSPGRLKEDREKTITHRQRERDLRCFPSSVNRTWEEFVSNNRLGSVSAHSTA